MSRSIEIRLNDDQHAALAAAAEASGQTFFNYCRARLLANVAVAMPVTRPAEAKRWSAEPVAKGKSDERMDRLEEMVRGLAGMVQSAIAQPEQNVLGLGVEETELVDVDSVVGELLADVEVEPEAPQQQMTAGVRHVGPRPPTPFTQAPRHLRGV